MYNSFSVRNFRGFREATLSELAHVNLITGLNDAGKTSLIEAMFLHASGGLAGGHYLQLIMPGRGRALGIGTSGASSPWKELFRGFDETEVVELSAKTGQGDLLVQIFGRSERSERAVPVSTGPGDSNNAWSASVGVSTKIADADTQEYRQSISVQSSGGVGGGAVNVSLQLDPPTAKPFMDVAIVLGNVGPDLAQAYSQLRRGKTGVNLLDGLRAIDPRITGLEVLVENGRPELHAEIENTLMPFELLGEGVGAVAKYLLSMQAVPNGLLLIDEVGAGIHHSALPKLWQVLWRAAERLNVQIVATTHSAECVRAAEEVLYKRNRALIVHRLRRSGEEEVTRVVSYGDEKLRTALNMNVELR